MVIDLKKLMPVLVGIHLVALPFYQRTHALILFLIFILSIWVFFIIIGKLKQPSTLLRLLALVFSVVLLIIANGTIFGQIAGTSLLLLLSFFKIFEIKNKRDINIIIFMSYFIIASNFFYSQSPLMAMYVIAVVIYLTSILIYLSDVRGSISFRSRLLSAARMTALSIPFMLILFILFPRLPSPLWGLPKDAQSATTGLGEEMTPGNINKLVTSGKVAFRVSFDGDIPPHHKLYWRGPVLTSFDGKTWKKDNAPRTATANLIEDDSPIQYKYTISLEPHNKNWLLSLEHPTAIDTGLRLSRELQLINNKPVTNLMGYTLISSININNVGLFEQEANRNLLLPADYNPRTRQLASQFYRQANGDAETIVELALSYFRDEPFYYTLTPPLLGLHSMDDFLFDTKKGFCGHYTSAFVTLMRNAGIPARVVTGYQGGTINPVDDYMIVRQADAHAWAEVWLNEKGWTRVDPTAAVSPARIESGIADAGLEENRLPSVYISDNVFFNKSRYILDSLNNNWNNWIIGYNQKQQKKLFNKMGFEKVDAANLTLWLVIAMTSLGAIVSAFMFRASSNRSTDKVLHYYNVFCKKFNKAGLIRQRHQGEEEFLDEIKRAFPKNARSAEIITHSYQQIRYNGISDTDYLKNFIKVVKNFRVIKN